MQIQELKNQPAPQLTIKPRPGWQPVDLGELWHYRDLFLFFVWRDIKVRYAQSVLGVGWAVVQPLFSVVVFTVVFGNMAEVSSDGLPYYLFSVVGVVPWTFFANALTDATASLINNANMIGKVYFPRLALPVSAVLGKLVDFAIALGLTLLLVVAGGYLPTPGAIVWVPLLTLLLVVTAAGAGMWLTALAIQYRDIRYGLTFGVQILIYAAPVVYPATLVAEGWRTAYALNPMVGVIEGFRATLLGHAPVPLDLVGTGAFAAAVLFVSGAYYFRRMEKYFADVA